MKPDDTPQGDLVVYATQELQVEEINGRKILRFQVPPAMQGHTFELELNASGRDTAAAGPFRIEYVLGSEFLIHQPELPPQHLQEGFSHISVGSEFDNLRITLAYSDDKEHKISRTSGLSLRVSGDGVLQRIVVETNELNHSHAIRSAGQIVADLLDALSFMMRVPLTVRHIEVYGSDDKNQLRYVTLPYGTRKLQPNDIQHAAGFPNRLTGPLRLFREGLSSNKPHYRLLCMYRIREALKPIQYQNDREIQSIGKVSDRPRRLLEDNPLTRTYFTKFIGKKVGAFLDHVRSVYRLPLAHGSLDDYFTLILDPADVRIDHRVDFANAALIQVIGEVLQDEVDLMLRHNLEPRQDIQSTPPA
jgi:hypothetical protein